MAVLKVLLGLFAFVILIGVGFLAYAWRPEIPPVEPAKAATFDKAAIERGAELAVVGNCASCHTKTGGQLLAGGRAFKTPFGTIYSPNITPDPETGLGQWSEAAFQRAMREGVNRNGEHLYPAFPYDHFTLVTDEDNRALYAYLMSRPAKKAEAHPNELPFPLSNRLSAAVWKLLFFTKGPYQPNPSQPANWNRGAYLVNGLAHCGACHTPRNRLGAEQQDMQFAGGEIDGWYAYAINPQSSSPTQWTVDALAFYLRNGWQKDHGVARGPMSPVVVNLAAAPEADVRAIAVYVGGIIAQAATGSQDAAGRSTAMTGDKTRRGSQTSADSMVSAPSAEGKNAKDPGANIYAAACATCHEAGRPLPFGGVNLALSSAIHGASPRNLINVTLYGLPSTPGERSPIMPGFRASLSDQQIEALVNHLRATAGKPAWSDVAAIVREARNSDTAPPLYPSPGTDGAPADPSQKGAAW